VVDGGLLIGRLAHECIRGGRQRRLLMIPLVRPTEKESQSQSQLWLCIQAVSPAVCPCCQVTAAFGEEPSRHVYGNSLSGAVSRRLR
jgi:hypothetical protein